jgi:hypothetical protein
MSLSDLPPPMVPAEVTMVGLEYMPLYRQRLQESAAWRRCRRRPELAFYLVNMWFAAFFAIECGSIEADDDAIIEAADCHPRDFDGLREELMRGWVLCSNGRYYHETIAEIVLEVWETRSKVIKDRAADRVRKKERRAARAVSVGRPAKSGDGPDDVVRKTEDVHGASGGQTDLSGGRPADKTEIPPEIALKRREETNREDSPQPPSGGAADAAGGGGRSSVVVKPGTGSLASLAQEAPSELTPSPRGLIGRAFDDAQIEVYGDRTRRAASPTNEMHAADVIAGLGLPLEFVREAMIAEMRQRQQKSGQQLQSITYFRPIFERLAAERAAGKVVIVAGKQVQGEVPTGLKVRTAEDDWLLRLSLWLQNGFWSDSWPRRETAPKHSVEEAKRRHAAAKEGVK